MSRLKAIHWMAPTTMVMSLIIGSLFALGHHLFYASLDGHAVTTGTYEFVGKKLQIQQFNTSVGTAFAFLIRTFLALAVSTAYIQVFWRCTKEARQCPTIGELDWAAAGMDNPLTLLNLKLWLKYPLLILLAVIFWCVPIAAIIPPATLSVKGALLYPSTMLSVPQLDFTSFNYVTDLQWSVGNDWDWSGPSQPLQNIAMAVMGSGQILAITPPSPNASWTLDFWGPALQCNHVSDLERDKIWLNLWHAYDPGTIGPHMFLSWVPWSLNDLSQYEYNYTTSLADPDLPFVFDLSNGTSNGGPTTASISTGGPASLFVAALPAAGNMSIASSDGSDTTVYWSWPEYESCAYSMVERLNDSLPDCSASNSTFTPAMAFNEATLLRCNLVNTSYLVNFNYTSGAQDIEILRNVTGHSPVVNASAWFTGPPPGVSNETKMSNCSSFRASPIGDDGKHARCFFDAEAVRLSSYQGIMDAFSQLLLGDIQNLETKLAVSTSVMRTVLADTNELAFIRNWNPLPDNTSSAFIELQSVLLGSSGWAYPGLVSPKPLTGHGDLKSALEQLFQNFTISLLADSYFQPNYSSPFAPPELTNVIIETYENIYDYDWVTLWVSYALSILFTMVAVLIGISALILNGAAYSNNFSTTARISRAAELSVHMMSVDGLGHDPIPQYLKEACFTILDTYSESTLVSEKSHAIAWKQKPIGIARRQPQDREEGGLHFVDDTT